MRHHKNTPIPWSVKELHNYSETPLFIDMVLQNKWLDNVYTNDFQQNDRLQFIRRWWEKNMRELPPVKKTKKNRKFAPTQLKLF
jgi:hypothetical protein